jgi:hypothetical protein
MAVTDYVEGLSGRHGNCLLTETRKLRAHLRSVIAMTGE